MSAPSGDHLSTRVRLMAMAARVYTGFPQVPFSGPTTTDGDAEPGRDFPSPSPFVSLTAH